MPAASTIILKRFPALVTATNSAPATMIFRKSSRLNTSTISRPTTDFQPPTYQHSSKTARNANYMAFAPLGHLWKELKSEQVLESLSRAKKVDFEDLHRSRNFASGKEQLKLEHRADYPSNKHSDFSCAYSTSTALNSLPSSFPGVEFPHRRLNHYCRVPQLSAKLTYELEYFH